MKKRAQLTLFVIIAIIVFFAIISFFVMNNRLVGDFSEDFLFDRGLSPELESIRSEVFSCIDESVISSMVRIGIQGGYSQKPDLSYEFNSSFFSYYYYEGEFLNPSIGFIEDSLSDEIDSVLLDCFESRQYPIKTTFSRTKTDTKIRDEEVLFVFDGMITIEEADKVRSINLNEKEFSFASKLKGMIEIAEFISEYHKQDPIYYCISCIELMAIEKGVKVDIFNFIENNTRQVVISEELTISPDRFMFSFLNKYTGQEVSPMFGED